MEEEMISTISNGEVGLTNLSIAERSDSNSSTNPPRVLGMRKRRREENTSSSNPRFKGVVMQQNGHWGAQIYANHQRIWLGTFKTEKEAAMAYDSAAIKLRRGDSHRNLPWTDITIQEPNFQDLYTTEGILAMIKDGSYQSKFIDFIMSKCLSITETNQRHPHRRHRNEQGILYHELFQKELTPSDVGKLNRLVIPKKQAMSFFPKIHRCREVAGVEAEAEAEAEAGQDDHRADTDNKVEAMHLTFYDNQYKAWSFRYCYWKSSQSFVFTKGWNKFVKEKSLKANDIVSFYLCDYRNTSRGEVQTFILIDTKSKNIAEETRIDGYGGRREIMELEHGLEEINPTSTVMEEEHVGMRRPEVINKGIRLFGINIIS